MAQRVEEVQDPHEAVAVEVSRVVRAVARPPADSNFDLGQDEGRRASARVAGSGGEDDAAAVVSRGHVVGVRARGLGGILGSMSGKSPCTHRAGPGRRGNSASDPWRH
jgi:hypothetical protein